MILGNNGPLLDFTDAQLDEMITKGMMIKFDDPVMANFRDTILELTLRVQELRRLAKTGATEHNGAMWVKADHILALLDGQP